MLIIYGGDTAKEQRNYEIERLRAEYDLNSCSIHRSIHEVINKGLWQSLER
jgi:hypothetical protein